MTPDPGNWRKTEALWRTARELAPAERAAFLTEACAGDDALRRDVERLLTGSDSQSGQADASTRELSRRSADAQAAANPQTVTSLRFEVLRRVGAGGMGVVFEAWDRERNIRTALKTLAGFSPEALYRFKNEFRSLADISHPHLVGLHELFSEQGQWFFSMEYVEGAHFLEYVRPQAVLAPGEPTLVPGQDAEITQTVDALLLPTGGCDMQKLRSALGQLAEAVAALHAAGILHRDLKPANVKVTPEGRVVVLDFGLAEHFERAQYEESNTHAALTGTVPYMSPEQVKGKAITQATDWYAVGVMLFEALTGRRPFEGSVTQILVDKERHDPPAASELAIGVPEDLNEICTGLLERDPARRMTGEQVMVRLGWKGTGAETATQDQPQRAEQIFVGREAQLGVLRAAFAATERGAAALAFVHGPSGIGKSALVNHFLGELGERSGAVILAGRCYEQESMPYKALDSAVDALSRYLVRLPRYEAGELTPRDAAALTQIFPVLRRVEAMAEAPERSVQSFDQHELRRRAFGALRELLARLGDRRRVVLYIDDLQWGDADSASLLREVLGGPDAPSLLLIGSWRDGYEGRSAFLDAMNQEAPGDVSMERHDIPLGPLSNDDTRQLAMRLADSAGGGVAETIARECEGNPYLLEELAAGAASGDTLEGVLQRRVAALPENVRRLMEIVALSGRPLGQREAWTAAGLEVQDPKMLSSLRAARLIGGAGATIECYHDRVRETILAHMDPAGLQRGHAQLAEVLAETGEDAETIASHFEGAGKRERAVHYYLIAAESASATLAFRHAADLYQRTLELSDAQWGERRRLLVQLAEALANAGRGQEAALTYRQALDGAPDDEVFELERKIAYWHSVSGHVDEGSEALKKMLRRVGIRTPGSRIILPAMALKAIELQMRGLKFHARPEDQIARTTLDRLDGLWEATCSFGMIDVPMGIYFTGCNLLLALKAGEPRRIVRALMLATVGAAGLPVIGRTRAFRLMEVLEKLGSELGTPYGRAAVLFARSFVDFCLEGRWKKGVEQLQEAEQIFAKGSGLAWEASTARIFSLWGMGFMGLYTELGRRARIYLRDARERGDLYEETSIGAETLPFADFALGRPDEALVTMDGSLSKWTRQTYTSQHATSAYMRAWIFLYKGEGPRALAFLEGEWPKLRSRLYDRLGMLGPWLHYARGESALASFSQTGRPADMLRVAESAFRRLNQDPVPYAQALAGLIQAGCAASRGDRAGAVRLLESSAGQLEELDMAMMAAAARWRLGEFAGGERGREWMAAAESAMKKEGVREPERLANAFVNGFRQAVPRA